ncbi:MAG: FtsX-like permease family protein [Chloroflexi bacterium]|nr:FtsX-like permease family protein [Chloroflexota bacterium]
MILRNLLRRKVRTGLTLLGIAIGVAIVITLGALAEGIAEGYSDIFGGTGADLLVGQADALDVSIAALDERIGQRIAALPMVRDVSGVVVGYVSLPSQPYFIVFGHDIKQRAIRHFKIVEGQALSGPHQILLGKAAAKHTKLGVGDSMRLYQQAFRIVGIYETGSAFEEGAGVITMKDAQAVFNRPRKVNYFQVSLQDPRQAKSTSERIERLFPDVTVSEAADAGNRQQTVQMMNGMAWGLALIAVLIGGLGMMNTMIMTVFERTREIGTLRALGWGQARVIGMILREALLLSLAGGVLGIGLGYGLVWLAVRNPALGSFMSGKLTPILVIQAMAVAVGLGLVGGLYPAWWAARLRPVEALRYEGQSAGGGKRLFPFLPLRAENLPRTLRDLTRRRTRTLLAAVGIGIGVASIFALTTMADGFVQQLTDLNSKAGADLVLRQAEVADMSLSAIDERVGRGIAAMPGVESVSGMIFSAASTEGLPYLLIWGLDPNERAIRHYDVVEGRSIQRRDEIIVGRQAAEGLKKGVGDRIKLFGSWYKIVGIYESSVAYEGVGSVIALREAQSLFQKPRQVSFYQVKVRDPARIEAIRRTIEARFPEVNVSKTAEFAENTQDMQVFYSMARAIGFVAIIVGGIGVINTMLMSIFERTREIGTMRALGWRQRKIIGSVLRESILLGLLSGAVGILLGWGLLQLIGLTPGSGDLFRGMFSMRRAIE